MAKIMEASALLVSGFANPWLNNVYTRSSETLVAGHPTFWSPDGGCFIYLEAMRSRLHISIRWEICPGGYPTDILTEVCCGKVRGFAVQKEAGDVFEEYVVATQCWQDKQVEIHAISVFASHVPTLNSDCDTDLCWDMSLAPVTPDVPVRKCYVSNCYAGECPTGFHPVSAIVATASVRTARTKFAKRGPAEHE